MPNEFSISTEGLCFSPLWRMALFDLKMLNQLHIPGLNPSCHDSSSILHKSTFHLLIFFARDFKHVYISILNYHPYNIYSVTSLSGFVNRAILILLSVFHQILFSGNVCAVS